MVGQRNLYFGAISPFFLFLTVQLEILMTKFALIDCALISAFCSSLSLPLSLFSSLFFFISKSFGIKDYNELKKVLVKSKYLICLESILHVNC